MWNAAAAGHGGGCIDITTRFCGRERGKDNADRSKDHQQHHNLRLCEATDDDARMAEQSNLLHHLYRLRELKGRQTGCCAIP